MANELKRVVRIDPARHLDAMIPGPIEPLLLLALDNLFAVRLGVLEGHVVERIGLTIHDIVSGQAAVNSQTAMHPLLTAGKLGLCVNRLLVVDAAIDVELRLVEATVQGATGLHLHVDADAVQLLHAELLL